MALKTHPALTKLRNAGIGGLDDVVILEGLVMALDAAQIELRPDVLSPDSITIATGDVVHEEQADENSPARLFVHRDAAVTISTTAEGLRALMKPKKPSEGAVRACVRESRDRCISDVMAEHDVPRSEAERICDQFVIRTLREERCRNPGGIWGGGPAKA